MVLTRHLVLYTSSIYSSQFLIYQHEDWGGSVTIVTNVYELEDWSLITDSKDRF